MKFQCNVCGKTKTRIQAPTETKTYRYLDEKGRAWNYRQCPPCAYTVRKKAKSNFNERAKKQLNAIGPELLVKMTNRLCKVCNKRLPESCYFWHEDCRPGSFYNGEMVTYTFSNW